MYTYICIYTHMVDIMSLVYSGYSEVIHGKLIHLKQFLEAARLRDAGFENVRRPESLGICDLSQQKSHKPNQPSSTVLFLSCSGYRFATSSISSIFRPSRELESSREFNAHVMGARRLIFRSRYPGPKLLASMQRSSVCWNVEGP